tara:strand:- start:844 stop:1269 length:426 start_codon:yes stop_codon:yes gene_type:complete
MEKEIKKEYSNGELTIVWKPVKCIHAAECVKALPKVYNPNRKPWINAEGANTTALKNQIGKCPSGALSYYIKDEDPKAEESSETKVEVLKNGPLLLHGKLCVKDKDGNEVINNEVTAFCRCGASSNKPYCDGSHIKYGFKD